MGAWLPLLAAIYSVVIGVIGISTVKPKDKKWPKKVWGLFALGLLLALFSAWQQAVQLRNEDIDKRTAENAQKETKQALKDTKDALAKIASAAQVSTDKSAAEIVTGVTARLASLLPPPAAPPNVTACLVDSKRPALVLVNSSDVVAEQIMYSYALFDLDANNPNEPLHIPTAKAEFIRPHQAGGPENIFDSVVGPPATKDGDRIVGSIAISCPRCAIGRTYLVSITLGTTGWFALVEGRKDGLLEAPIFTDPTKSFFSAAGFLPLLDKIPLDKRIRIVDQRAYYARGKTLADCPL